MKFSAIHTAVVSALVLGTAQTAAGEIHVGHRHAHQHYKRAAHSHDAVHAREATFRALKAREAAASQLEAPASEKRQPQSIESLPTLFTRNAASSRTAALAPRWETDEIPSDVSKRAVCSLPSDSTIVSVPGASNGGWAMAPDVSCTAGMWCPIACASGMVMAQWKPGTTYVYPESMDGGLYCGSDGTPTKGFPDQPYCVEGTGSVVAVNDCGPVVSFCQTVLPGDEGMYIPTDVTGTSTLAVPGPSYWDSTAAHFYINPPGTSGTDGCIWGTDANPIGNWSPYVAGANTVSNGDTYVKIGWNPVYTASGLASTKPTFGVAIECDGSGCNGLPCSISADNVNDFTVTSANSAAGAGGADFCVVTVPSGGQAKIRVFNLDGSTSSSSSSTTSSGSSDSDTSSPTTSSTSTTSSKTTSSKTTSSKTTSTTSTSSSSSTSTSKASKTSTTSETSSSDTSSEMSESSSAEASSSHKTTVAHKPGSTTFAGGIFHENGTVSSDTSSTATSVSPTEPTSDASDSSTATTGSASTSSSKSEAVNHHQGGAAVVGLIVAVVAGLWLY